MILDVTTQIQTLKTLNCIGGVGGTVVDICQVSTTVDLDTSTADIVVWQVLVEAEEEQEELQTLFRRYSAGGYEETRWLDEETRRLLDRDMFAFTGAGHRFWDQVLGEDGKPQTRISIRRVKVQKKVRTSFLVARQKATEEQLAAERRRWETDFSEFVF